MFETLRNAFKVEDLRKKILYTLLIIVLYRIGSAFPVPYLDTSVIGDMFSQAGNLLGYMDVLTGGGLSNATVFALSIQPYINASIIMQLLQVAIPYFERLAKDGGEEGKKKLEKYTRYASLILAVILAAGYYLLLRRQNAVVHTEGWMGIFTGVVIVLTFVAGAMLVVWLGERINEKGIGNGISLIIFAGILSRGPSALAMLWGYIQAAMNGYYQFYFLVPLVVILFVVLIGFIVMMTNAERRIPVQYPKRVVGRKMMGGNSSYVPIKVNMSGVMPIIFAGAIIAVPGTIGSFVNVAEGSFWATFLSWFNYNHPVYAILYFLLIVAFSYFYVTIQFNPNEIANNLRKQNGIVPGMRPGKPTADYISKILSKITFIGALFLGFMAVLPILLGAITGMNISLGGTSILILVGVALDTMRTLESQMMMRHYKGFLE